MLIAEIHGKRNEAIQSDEDYLTSAVFGHLRHVDDGSFWRGLFSRAKSVRGSDLTSELQSRNFEIPRACNVEVTFWPYYKDYGEPDLLLRFIGEDGRRLLVLVEAKLFSTKSGIGENDQLKTYFELLSDRNLLTSSVDLTALVYLTARYSVDEVAESVAMLEGRDADRWMFALQWQDITSVAEHFHDRNPLIREVEQFLAKRGLEVFSGFKKIGLDITDGHFYKRSFFQFGDIAQDTTITGIFYDR